MPNKYILTKAHGKRKRKATESSETAGASTKPVDGGTATNEGVKKKRRKKAAKVLNLNIWIFFSVSI